MEKKSSAKLVFPEPAPFIRQHRSKRYGLREKNWFLLSAHI